MAQLQSTGITGSLNVTGTATANGSILGGGNLFLRSYNTDPKGIFFRDGFEYGDTNQYNLSITIYDDGDGAADGMNINAYDGIFFNVQSGTTPSTKFRVLNTEVRAYTDIVTTGDLIVSGSHIKVNTGTNGTPQSTDYLYIGGDNLASADGAIYIGNRGDGTGYGYRIYYSGVGSGNNNKLILKSENLGSTVDMLTFTADGVATFANDVVVAGTLTAQEFHTEYVSSSILFESGSTAFGNTDDDVHNFTGSLIVNRNPGTNQGTVLTIENKGDYGSAQDIILRNPYDRDIGIKFQTLGGEYYQWLDSNGDDAMIFSAAGSTRGTDATLILQQDHNVVIPNGDLTVGGGDIAINKAAGAATITFFRDANLSTNTLIGQLLFEADYQDSPIDYARIDVKSNASSVRTDMDFVVKSTSGNLETALKLQGGSATPKAFFYNEVSASAFIGDGSQLTNVGASTATTASHAEYADNAGQLGGIDAGNYLRSNADDTTSGNLTIGKAAPILFLHDNNNAGGGGAEARIVFKNTAGNAMFIGYTADDTSTSDLLITNNAPSTYGGYGGLDTGAITDPANIIIDAKTNVLLAPESGSVGIGTTSPNAKLEVLGGSAFRTLQLSSENPAIYFNDTQESTHNWHIGANAGSLYFLRDTDNNGAYNTISGYFKNNGDFIFNEGDVGIGTSSPSTPLHVIKSGAGEQLVSIFENSTNAGGTKAGIQLRNATNDVCSIKILAHRVGANAGSDLAFELSDSSTGAFQERMRITEDGNVGIGTDTPNTHLHIYEPAASSTATTDMLKLQAYTGDFGATPAAIALAFKFQDSNNLTNEARIRMATVNDTDYGDNDEAASNLIFSTTDGGTESDKMIITGRGSIGIGTTNPTYTLDVIGEIGVDSYIRHNGDTDTFFGFDADNSYKIRTGGTDRFAVTSDVNINSATDLNINGASRRINFTSGTGTIRTTTANALYLATNSSTAITIDSSQNVGIGTTSPQKAFEVIGTDNNFVSVGVEQLSVGQWTGIHFGYRENNTNYRKSAIVFERTDLTSNDAQGKIHILNGPQGSSSSATLSDAKITIAENGNVGIGETSPTAKLEVYGSGSTVLDIQGSQGQLFSITDDLTGDLLVASDISGIPIFTVNAADGVTVDGDTVLSGSLTVTGSDNSQLTVLGNASFGLPGNGSNTLGRYISIEGNADTSGEGSGRIFFTEHNSTTTSMSNYGMSIGYRGGGTSIVGADGNTWTGLSAIGNGQWGMWGHDNDATGALIMFGDRSATYVDFSGNNIQGINDIYVADQIIHTGDTDTYTQFHAADQWRVVTGGTERLEVNNSQITVAGNLSIGGTASGNGSGLTSLNASNISSGTISGDRLPWANNDGFTGTYPLVWKASNTPYTATWLNVNGTTDVLHTRGIEADGTVIVNNNVGIGTTTTNGKLELYGSGQSWSTAPVIRMWDSYNSLGWLVGSANNQTAGDFYIRTLPAINQNPGASNLEFTIKHSNGFVGIGTTSPGYALDVVGDIQSTNMYLGGYLYHSGDTNTYIRMIAADDMQLVAGGRQMLRMDEGTDPDKLRFVNDDNWTNSSGQWNMSGAVTMASTLEVGDTLTITSPTTGTTAANRAFQVNATEKGAIHIEGAQGGTNASADTIPLLTFPGSSLDTVQGGLYLSQNSSTGTTLGIFTTDSYATGPQLGLSVQDNGIVNIPRGSLNVEGNVNAGVDVNVGDGSGQSRILIKKLDNNTSDHIQFYNGTTRVGEIGCQDTTWLRINQQTAKNIYTPRYIRADGGLYVDSTSYGINGSGQLLDASLSGTYTNNLTFSGDIEIGGRFRRLERDREYGSITGTATADGWYLIGTITDNGSTPTTFHVQTYAHSSVMFTISDAYGPSNYAHIQVLDHIYGANGGYANVKGIRVRNDGTVAIQLGWSSGPSVAVKVSAFGPGDLVLPSTLALETSTATVNDTVSLTTATKGMMRSHGTMDAPNFRNTNNTSYSLTPQSAATGYWQVNTPSGFVQIGPANSSWNHFSTDRAGNYFNVKVIVDGGTIGSYNQDLNLVRANSNADRILIRNTSIGFFLDSAEDMRLENDGDLHVEGDVIAYSTTISDSRLKDDVITIGGALDKVKKLRGVEYTWNNGSRKDQRDLGLIAQEVEEVIPEIVREKKMPLMDDSETKYKTVDYEKLTAVLIEGMKEQQAQIEELKARIDELERK